MEKLHNQSETGSILTLQFLIFVSNKIFIATIINVEANRGILESSII